MSQSEQPKQTSSKQATGHDFAIQDIAKLRRESREAMKMIEAATDIHSHAVFVPNGRPNHVQAKAHAIFVTFYEEIANNGNLSSENSWELWQEDIIEVAVPEISNKGKIKLDVDSEEAIDSNVALTDLETEQRPESLKSLGWWEGRTIDVEYTLDIPYANVESKQTVSKRVFMPPRLISAVYSQLNDVLDSMGVLLQIKNRPLKHLDK